MSVHQRHQLARIYATCDISPLANLLTREIAFIDPVTREFRRWVQVPDLGDENIVERGAVVSWRTKSGARCHFGIASWCEALLLGDDVTLDWGAGAGEGSVIASGSRLRQASRALDNSLLTTDTTLDEAECLPGEYPMGGVPFKRSTRSPEHSELGTLAFARFVARQALSLAPHSLGLRPRIGRGFDKTSGRRPSKAETIDAQQRHERSRRHAEAIATSGVVEKLADALSTPLFDPQMCFHAKEAGRIAREEELLDTLKGRTSAQAICTVAAPIAFEEAIKNARKLAVHH